MISIRDITKSFNKRVVLIGVSFDFEPGKISLIKGQNGSGKTTLMNIISNLIRPDSGEIFLSGTKISFHDYNYRNIVGYSLDYPFLIEKLTAYDYLTFLLNVYKLYNIDSKKNIINYLDMFKLPINIPIEKFSRGMKKKTSFIGAIIHNPKYLVLDEPFNSLDPASINLTIDILEHMKTEGKTIIIASPTPPERMMIDRALVLNSID